MVGRTAQQHDSPVQNSLPDTLIDRIELIAEPNLLVYVALGAWEGEERHAPRVVCRKLASVLNWVEGRSHKPGRLISSYAIAMGDITEAMCEPPHVPFLRGGQQPEGHSCTPSGSLPLTWYCMYPSNARRMSRQCARSSAESAIVV